MKKAISILLCLSMLLALCACASEDAEPTTGNPVASGSGHATKDEEKVEEKPEESEKQEYTLSEYLATGETIWFELKDVSGKDSKVTEIYVLEPDGSAYFVEDPGYTLGEVEQMEDAEIAATVKETYINAYANAGYTLADNELIAMDLLNCLFITTEDYEGQWFCEPGTNTLDKQAYISNAGYGVSLNVIENDWEAMEEIYGVWNAMCYSMGNRDFIWYMTAIAMEYYGYSPVANFDEDMEYELTMFLEQGGCSEAEAEQLRTAIATMLEIGEQAAERGNQRVKEKIEERRTNPELAQYRLSIVSDSTGNETRSMIFTHNDPKTKSANTNDTELYTYAGAAPGGNSNCIVYDSEYNGYWTENGALYTRLNGDIELVLDQIGESDLPIDVKDMSTLFE